MTKYYTSKIELRVEITKDTSCSILEIVKGLEEYINKDIDEENPNDFGVAKVKFEFSTFQ